MRDVGLAGDARASSRDLTLQRLFRSWEGLLERLPVGVYVCDADGAIAHYNQRAAELWGYAPNGLQARADGRRLATSQAVAAEVLATGAAVKDREIAIEHADGRDSSLLANAEPLMDDDGQIIGVVSCVQDITEFRQARDKLRARQGWSRRLLEASPVAIYQTDKDGVIVGFNSAAAALWGREPKIGEDRWCGSFKLYQPDGRPMPLQTSPMAQAIREQRQIAGAEAIFERPDGGRGAFLAYPTPLFEPDGELAGAINVLVDITERKRAEDIQKTLLDELNHRVKNTLATVQSLAAHSFHDDGDPAGMRQAFEARLMALSGAHNQLAVQRWEAADLTDIVAEVLGPYSGEAVFCEGPAVQLPTRVSVTLAMVLHELATNAGKCGSLSSREGRLVVHWTRTPEGLALEWRETGGPPASKPSRDGFGLRFIRGAVQRELAGQVSFDFAESGLRCRLSAPLPVEA